MRKHTNGGGWECIWCGFNTVTANRTKALSCVAKVKLLGVNVSMCVAKIPYSQLARYQALLKKNWGKNSSRKCAQEQVNRYINKL